MRVVCRVHDGDNEKSRPSWFSKELALASLIRAGHGAGASILFLTDGPVRPSLLRLLESAGTVEPVRRGGSARRSYRAMVARAAEDVPDDEMVWFAEDDYLYRPDALVEVAAVADGRYLTVVGSAARDPASSRWAPRAYDEPGTAPGPGAVRWFRSMATTSTFGMRGQVLREDVRVLRVCPFAGGSWDTTTSLVLQGVRPFEMAGLASAQGSVVRDGTGRVVESAAGSDDPVARVAARAGVRLAVSTLALRRPSRRRILLAPDPELALHAEEGPHRSVPSPATAATDWADLASQTRDWLRDVG